MIMKPADPDRVEVGFIGQDYLIVDSIGLLIQILPNDSKAVDDALKRYSELKNLNIKVRAD